MFCYNWYFFSWNRLNVLLQLNILVLLQTFCWNTTMLVMVRRAGADGGRVLVTTMAAVHWNRSTAEASTQRGVHEKRDSKLAAALVLQGPTTLTTARSSEGAARQRRRGAGRRGAESRWQFGLVGRGYCNREPNLLEPARRFARTSNQKCYYWSSSSGRCYDHILFLLPPAFSFATCMHGGVG